MNSLRRANGFTIVELLVVIVVIGILAAITIVSYSGISQRAKEASIFADLSNASKLIDIFAVSNPNYPDDIASCPTPSAGNMCLKSSPGNQYVYSVDNLSNPKLYSLAVVSCGSQYLKISNAAAQKVSPVTGTAAGATSYIDSGCTRTHTFTGAGTFTATSSGIISISILGAGGGGSAPYFTSGFAGGHTSVTFNSKTYTATGGCGGAGEFGPGTCPATPSAKQNLTLQVGGGATGGAPECSDGCGDVGFNGDKIYGNLAVTAGQVITISTVGAGGAPAGAYQEPPPQPGTAGSVVISYSK